MNVGSIITMIVLIILLIIFVVWIFKKDQKIAGYTAANSGSIIEFNSKLEDGDGSNLAFSIWVYVTNWSTTDKYIYTIGDDDGDQLQLYLYGSTPKLIVSTLGGGVAGTPFANVEINNFPLQTWVCVAVSIYNSSMDVYINGKLVKTQLSSNSEYLVLDGNYGSDGTVKGGTLVPITLFNSSAEAGDSNNGFEGYINKFKYWSSALTPHEAWNIYKSGPGGTIFGNLISGRSVDINLKNGNEITSSFTI